MEQKKFDFNSFIGMILLGGIFLWWANSNREEIATDVATEIVADSTKVNTTNALVDAKPIFANDSLKAIAQKSKLGAFAYSAMQGKEGVYDEEIGFHPYNPVLVTTSSGEEVVNLTDYSGGVQGVLSPEEEKLQFIHNGRNLIFNRLIDEPFRAYYQYLPSNTRLRIVLRSNHKDFVTPKVHAAQVKAKIHTADSRTV